MTRKSTSLIWPILAIMLTTLPVMIHTHSARADEVDLNACSQKFREIQHNIETHLRTQRGWGSADYSIEHTGINYGNGIWPYEQMTFGTLDQAKFLIFTAVNYDDVQRPGKLEQYFIGTKFGPGKTQMFEVDPRSGEIMKVYGFD